MSTAPPLYDLDAASQLTHYAPGTISNRCHDGTLQRGRDFLVMTWRRGCYKRAVLVLTTSGIAALIARRSYAIRRVYEESRVAATELEATQTRLDQ